MKLTKSTDFALRLLTHLSFANKDNSTPVLAEQLHIPYNHLTKLVQGLTKVGFLQTKRGKNGGVSLNVSPEKITLKAVINVTEGQTKLVECFEPLNTCDFENSCHIKSGIFSVQEKIDQLFESVSLQDLIQDRKACQCNGVLTQK